MSDAQREDFELLAEGKHHAELRVLCVQAGLIPSEPARYEEGDGIGCRHCTGGLPTDHNHGRGQQCVDSTPDLGRVLDVLEANGMFRHSWTSPIQAAGWYEVEASFPEPPPRNCLGPGKGYRLHYGTGKTREIAAVRLLLDRRRNG